MNILIVDDKPNLARVTAVALRTLGCNSFTATSTAAASQMLATEKIDAVFLDLNLNGEDGFQFLSQLVVQFSQVPVILFTAHSREEIQAEALRRGAFDCLFKPFTLDDLRQQLAKIEQYRKPVTNNGV
jgi:two-component system response regulator PilR (NtrC family)